MPNNENESSAYSEPDVKLPVQLVIGFDFGTSFSKIVVGETRVRYAVPFEDFVIGDNPYLLPSSLSVLNETNQCSLNISTEAGIVYDNLKMPLIERDFSNNIRARAVAFMALVFQHTRTWLINTHGSVYKDREIEWFVNIGLPTDSFHDEELSSVYLTIAQAAWYVSEFEDDVNFSKVFEIVERNDAQSNSLPSDRINVFPEFSAQLAGYVRSPRRRPGLHVTIDVGGGTLDVTAFNVHKDDGEDVFPNFSKKVKPLGVRYLVEFRLREFNSEIDRNFSPFDDLLSNNEFANMFNVNNSKLAQIDEPFHDKVKGTIATVMLNTSRIFPKASHWDPTANGYGDPVPGFFCGGGVLSDFYLNLLLELEELDPPYRIRAIQLPTPDDLNALGTGANVYSRLAVAYGLSFDPFDIGRVRQVENVQRIDADPTDFRDAYVGPEQM